MLLHRLGDRLTLANCLGDFRIHSLEHGVPGRVARDVERFQNGHAAGDQSAERTRSAGQYVLFNELAEDGHFDYVPVPADAPLFEFAYELDRKPDRERDARHYKPVVQSTR